MFRLALPLPGRFAFWCCLSVACCLLASPAMALQASVIGGGLYGENISSNGADATCAGVHAKRLEDGRAAPTQLLTRFGVEVLVEGGAKGSPARLDVTLTHPPLNKPGAASPITQRQWETPACVGEPALVAWTFLADWELVPGEWTFHIAHGGKELLSAAFTVQEGERAVPEAQLSFSLAPKPEPAQPANATAIAPEQAIAILAAMRGVQPEQRAFYWEEERAAREVKELLESGVPAMAMPLLRATGVWRAVAVWDFTQYDQALVEEGAAQPEALAVQLGLFGEFSQAKAYADSLREYGVQAYIESLQWDGRVLHSVRQGPFDPTRSGRDQAAHAMGKLRLRGVRLPLLTLTPEPLPHAPQEIEEAQPAPVFSPMLPSMDSAKSKLSKLMQQTKPDEMLPQDLAGGEDQGAAKEQKKGGRYIDDEPRRRNEWGQPATPVETLAESDALGKAGSFAVLLGPIKFIKNAHALQKAVHTKERPAQVAPFGDNRHGVHVSGFPNYAAAKTAGEAMLRDHLPDAGLQVLVVKDAPAGSQQATQKASRGEAEEAGGAASQGAGESAGGKGTRYALQLASTASRDEAQRQAGAWREQGLDTAIIETPGALGVTYSVRSGEYATLAKAQQAAADLLQDHGMSAVVVETAPAGQ